MNSPVPPNNAEDASSILDANKGMAVECAAERPVEEGAEQLDGVTLKQHKKAYTKRVFEHLDLILESDGAEAAQAWQDLEEVFCEADPQKYLWPAFTYLIMGVKSGEVAKKYVTSFYENKLHLNHAGNVQVNHIYQSGVGSETRINSPTISADGDIEAGHVGTHIDRQDNIEVHTLLDTNEEQE